MSEEKEILDSIDDKKSDEVVTEQGFDPSNSNPEVVVESTEGDISASVADESEGKQVESSGEVEKKFTTLEEVVTNIERLIGLQDPVASQKEFKASVAEWERLAAGQASNESLEKFEILSAEFKKNFEWALWANFKKKEEICQEMETLLENSEEKALYDKFELLRKEWKKYGIVPNEKIKELSERYRILCQNINDKNLVYFEKNLKVKEALCEKIEGLQSPSNWQEASEFVKDAQRNWNSIGPVPRKNSDEIWIRFQTACNDFFSRQKDFFKELKNSQKDHLTRKRELCELVESFQDSSDWKTTSTKIHALQKEWKSIGSAGKKYENKLWTRFKGACDTFFNRQKEHFDSLDQQRPLNLQKKEELCQLIEQMDHLNDDEKYKLIIQTQEDWKKIGPVPKEKEQALWNRFRKPIDAYFDSRKEKYEQEKRSFDDNLARKEALCVEAEQLQESNNWDDTRDKLKLLQKQWNEIGRVSREKEHEVWRRFKKACDTFFSRLKDQKDQHRNSLQDNLKMKIDLCFQAEIISGISGEEDEERAQWQLEKLKENFWFKVIDDDSWEAKANKIKELQKDWKKIGPIPRARSQELWERFQKACNTFFDSRRR